MKMFVKEVARIARENDDLSPTTQKETVHLDIHDIHTPTDGKEMRQPTE